MTKEISTSRQLGATQVKKALMHCIKLKQPAMIWGPGGVGKSSIVKEISDNAGGVIYDVRLSQMEPTDLRGIPFYNRDSGKMDWAPPIDLPDAEDAKKYPLVLLFLDELSSAVPSVAAAAYQLILDRKVGKYELPDNCVVVAAGNREADRGVVYRMPAPLANRLIHLEMTVNFDDWLTWAIDNQINPDVVGYLSENKGDLYDFDSKSPSKAFATPRTWTFMSRMVDSDIDDETLINIASGTIGEGLALKFSAMRRSMKSMPKSRDVLSGKAANMTKKDISAMYSLTMSCAYDLRELLVKKDPTFDDSANNYLGYALDNFTPEVVVMGVRTLMQAYNVPLKATTMSNYRLLNERYGKLILKSAAV